METSPAGLSNANLLQVDFDTSNIRALIATHAHVDHIDQLPQLLATNFKGPILCSGPSTKLLALENWPEPCQSATTAMSGA